MDLQLQTKVCRQLLRAQRKLKLSQRALGERLAGLTKENWPQSRVWALLHGQGQWSIDTLDAAARLLQLRLVDLLVGATRANEPPIPKGAQRLIARIRYELKHRSAVVVVVPTGDLSATPRPPVRSLEGRAE